MNAHTFRLELLLATFGAWINREQAQVIDDLPEENRVLKEQPRGKRPRLTDEQPCFGLPAARMPAQALIPHGEHGVPWHAMRARSGSSRYSDTPGSGGLVEVHFK